MFSNYKNPLGIKLLTKLRLNCASKFKEHKSKHNIKDSTDSLWRSGNTAKLLFTSFFSTGSHLKDRPFWKKASSIDANILTQKKPLLSEYFIWKIGFSKLTQ